MIETMHKPEDENTAYRVVEEALKLQGVRTVLYSRPDKGVTPVGFDCSGFVSYVLQKAGVVVSPYAILDTEGNVLLNPVRHSHEYFDYFGMPVHFDNARPGDLVFFSDHGDRPSHIGIMVGSFHYIHANPKNRKVVVERFDNHNHFADGSLTNETRRGTNLYSYNPIGFKRIPTSRKLQNYRWVQRS
jgi:cell wall-associated NlpC family hydrolase